MAENKITIYGELESGVPGGYVTTADQVKGLDAISPMTVTTYEELVELCNAGNLVPGMKYMFKYVADIDSTGLKTDKQNVSLATTGKAMLMIVTALNAGTLNDEAVMFAPERQLLYDVRYSLTKGDHKTFKYYLWAADANHGVIYWMRDINGNEAPYDFVNIYFLVNGEPRYTFSYRESGTPVMEGSFGFFFKNNIIEACYTPPLEDSFGANQLIPYNCFIAENMNSEILNNRIGHRSYDIEINSLCKNNFIGSDCHGITLKKGSSGNVWKNGSTANIQSYNYTPLTLENNTFEENSSAEVRVLPYKDNTIIRNCRIGKNVYGSWILELEPGESSQEKYFTYNSYGNMDMYIGYGCMPKNTNPVKSILSGNGEYASWESMSSMVRSYKNVEFFDGIKDGVLANIVEAVSVMKIDGIYYYKDRKCFVAKSGDNFYMSWGNLQSSVNDYNEGGLARMDRIFEVSDTRYCFNGEDLVLYES